MREKETRFIPIDKLELRAEGDGDARKIDGYVAVYNAWSPVYGDFREQIAPGFFDQALSREDADVRALFNHDPNYVLGRTKSGTLELSSDDTGLRMNNSPPDTTWAGDLMESMRRGDITGASFTFSLPDEGGDDWRKGEDGIMERTLLQAERVYDVGPVTMPWYPDTSVSTKVAKRSLEAWEAEHAPAEEEAPDDAEEKAMPKSDEERGQLIEGISDSEFREALRVALVELEPAAEWLYVEAVYPRMVVYEMREAESPYKLYARQYERGGDGLVFAAERRNAKRRVSYEVVDEEGRAVDPETDAADPAPLALLEKLQKQKEAEAA